MVERGCRELTPSDLGACPTAVEVNSNDDENFPMSQSIQGAIEVGTRVRAHWRGLKALYGAVVTARHGVVTDPCFEVAQVLSCLFSPFCAWLKDDCEGVDKVESFVYDLLYDEGDEEYRVAPEKIYLETFELLEALSTRRAKKATVAACTTKSSVSAIKKFLQSLKIPRHQVHEGVFSRQRMDEIFKDIRAHFVPHIFSTINYDDWKISSYAECYQKKNPQPPENPGLLEALRPLLEKADEILLREHCRRHREYRADELSLLRMHSFVTRYMPNAHDCGLPLHIDGVGVDGSIIMGLPTPVPFTGGGVSVWDDAKIKTDVPNVERVDYPMNPGDVCYLDKMVWHQANDITSGERWALVIFYKIRPHDGPKGTQ